MKKIAMRFIAFLLIATGIVSLTVYAVELEKKIRFQGISEKDIKDTKNAVPQSMATDGKYIYLLKNREGQGTDDISYILKIKNQNTNDPKLMLPANSIKVGHANGMTYYKGYLYIAEEGQRIFKVKDEGGKSNSSSFNVEVSSEGTERYTVGETIYTLSGNSGEEIKNIAHYSGEYFIACLKRENNIFTYGIGVFQGDQFVIIKRFFVDVDTYPCIQDIDYSNGELWIVTSQRHDDSSESLKNHILRVSIPSSYDSVENNKTYKVKYKNKHKSSRKKNSKGKWDGTIKEFESICVIGDKYYVWTNSIEGWNEILGRYKEKNARTKP